MNNECTGKPLISIVIPTYKRVDMLSQILCEVKRQRADHGLNDNVEIVVVDNDPEGSAAEVVREDALFVSEPQPGVANARNAGVAAANGRYILFLDDDELPDRLWLSTFRRAALEDCQAAFGPVKASFEGTPPVELEQVLTEIFSRKLDAKPGSDISHLRAYLGTGNSMFHRETCLKESPFETDFNGGGEDVWLLRYLADDLKIKFRWLGEDATVFERVPISRCNINFIKERKFLGGMLRCVVESGSRSVKGYGRVSKWMFVGAVQFCIYGVLAEIQKRSNKSKAPHSIAQRHAGLGKLLWWTHPHIRGRYLTKCPRSAV